MFCTLADSRVDPSRHLSPWRKAGSIAARTPRTPAQRGLGRSLEMGAGVILPVIRLMS